MKLGRLAIRAILVVLVLTAARCSVDVPLGVAPESTDAGDAATETTGGD